MGKIFDEIIDGSEKHMARISEWFLHNCLKTNGKKFHLFFSPFVYKATNIENFTIKSSCVEVVLGVIIVSNLNYREHVTYNCQS